MKLRRLVIVLALLSFSSAVFATADGPDYFAVTGVAAGDTLNLRATPSSHARKIGEIPPDGRSLQNLGCQGLPSEGEWGRMSPRQRAETRQHYWCKVRWQGTEGWVAGRYLREDGPPEPGLPQPVP